jgi:ABC-type uncharacterized transport system permease subunit
MLSLVPRGGKSRFWEYASPVLALLLTAVTTGVIFALMGRPPVVSVMTFLIDPVFASGGLAAIAIKAAPLILMGVGLSLAYTANVWNIGTEGQFTIGAICGGGAALYLPDGSAFLVYPVVLAAGIAGGAAWAALVAWLKVDFNANEILTSLMFTYVAQYVLVYLVTGPWRDPEGFGFPQSAMFSDAASAPKLFEDSSVHLGILIAPVVAVLVWLVMERSVLGFRLRVLGQAPRAARFAGFSETRLVWISLLISGGLAGLAGVLEVTGTLGQLTTSISPGYGFTAIIVAFLARLNPLAVVPAGILLAISYLGGDAAQIELGLPNAVTGIFQGILLFFLLGCDVLIQHRIVWRKSRRKALS